MIFLKLFLFTRYDSCILLFEGFYSFTNFNKEINR